MGFIGPLALGVAVVVGPVRHRRSAMDAQLGCDRRGADVGRLRATNALPDARYVTTRAVTIKAPVERSGHGWSRWGRIAPVSTPPTTGWSACSGRASLTCPWSTRSGSTSRSAELMRTNHDIGGKPMGWPVVAVDPGRSLVVSSKGMPAGTYAFILDPLDGDTTRLIVRDRAHWKRSEWPFAALVFEPLQCVHGDWADQWVRREPKPDPWRGASRSDPSGPLIPLPRTISRLPPFEN